MATQSDNLRALQDAGFFIKTPLPSEYQEVLDSLTAAEVELLISIKTKFDAAEGLTAKEVGPYIAYFVPL
jgi:hypothetical protein